MRIDDLLKKPEGPMSKEWQEAHNLAFSAKRYEEKQQEKNEELGKELCAFAKRELAIICQKKSKRTWCSVSLMGPGYILRHDTPIAESKPYLRFSVSIGGTSRIEYNHWPQSRADIEAVCNRLAEAAQVLTRATSDARTAC